MPTTLDSMLAQSPDICGGRIRLDGTRITVHRIATLYRQGYAAEDILRTYPHLAISQVYAALAYYHANRAQIDAELAADDSAYDRLKHEELVRRGTP
jgi:uncharacterized protein (DUF433 family)